MLQASLACGTRIQLSISLSVRKEKNMIMIIEGVHVTSPGRQFLRTSAYFRIRTAKGKRMVRPIL